MTREELVNVIAMDAKLTKKQANAVIGAFIGAVGEALKGGDKVSLIGFGSFHVSQRKARTGVNPKTKKKITIAAHPAPVFKAGKELKQKVLGK